MKYDTIRILKAQPAVIKLKPGKGMWRIRTYGRVHNILRLFEKKNIIARKEISGTQFTSKHIAYCLLLGFMTQHKQGRQVYYTITEVGRETLEELNNMCLWRNIKPKETWHGEEVALDKGYTKVWVPVNVSEKWRKHFSKHVW